MQRNVNANSIDVDVCAQYKHVLYVESILVRF